MVGCGKLGLPCAEVMAEHYDVVGYDIYPDPAAGIPMLPTVEEAIKGRDIIFIAVPTPHDPIYGGDTPISHLEPRNFDYTPVIDVFQKINPVLTENQLVVLISTVLPGTVRRELIQYLKTGRFVYNPYLIAMGSVKWDMVNPECLIIGTEDGSTTGDAQELIDFYRPLMKNNPVINIGTWDEAESIKIFYNTFISAKIGLVNMIQDVAEANGNINVDVVTDALKRATQRITGPRYLTAGMGDAGACHPRDNIALRWLSSNLDLGYDLFQAIMGSRDSQAFKMATKLVSLARRYNLPVVIHGKAYKPYVPYTIGSYSLLVGHYVEKAGVSLTYADPLTGDTDVANVPAVVLMAHNPAVTYAGTGVEIRQDEFYYNIQPGSIIVDPWRSINQFPGCKVIHYGNPRFSRPKINGKILNPVTTSDVLLKMSTSYTFTADFSQPMTYIAKAPIDCVNSDEKAEPYIKSLREKAGKLRDQDRIVFFTPHEGMFAHAIFWSQRIAKFWPELKQEQWYYANELLSPEQAAQQSPGAPNVNLLRFVTIDQWVQRDIKVNHAFENKAATFLSYNRVVKSHRCHLVAELIANNLVAGNMISFVPEGEAYPGVVKSAESIVDDCGYLSQEQKDRYKPLLAQRLVIDDYDVTKPQGPVVSNHYEQSMISIVTETTYENGDVFLSEKTWKTIAHAHPFILVGPANSLEKLRQFGFKTFAPFINESYDSIVDNNQRMAAIVAEIKRISSLDEFSKRATYEAIAAIAAQNKKFFDEQFNKELTVGDFWQFFNKN